MRVLVDVVTITQPAAASAWGCPQTTMDNGGSQWCLLCPLYTDVLPTGGPRDTPSLLQLMLLTSIASHPCQCCCLVTVEPHSNKDLHTVRTAAAADATVFSHCVVHTHVQPTGQQDSVVPLNLLSNAHQMAVLTDYPCEVHAGFDPVANSSTGSDSCWQQHFTTGPSPTSAGNGCISAGGCPHWLISTSPDTHHGDAGAIPIDPCQLANASPSN